jgi:hypothetical protein
MTKVRNRPLFGTRCFRCPRTGSYGPANGILRDRQLPVVDRRLAQPLLRTHRRLHSHSWRLLRASQLAREVARVARWYQGRGGPASRPAPPPVAAFGEIETAFRAGIRSLRLWRWVRRHGGFPEPARVTPQGPIWTERQIATWLGEADPLDRLDVVMTAPAGDDEVSEDEATLLREIEQRGTARRRMREVA